MPVGRYVRTCVRVQVVVSQLKLFATAPFRTKRFDCNMSEGFRLEVALPVLARVLVSTDICVLMLFWILYEFCLPHCLYDLRSP